MDQKRLGYFVTRLSKPIQTCVHHPDNTCIISLSQFGQEIEVADKEFGGTYFGLSFDVDECKVARDLASGASSDPVFVLRVTLIGVQAYMAWQRLGCLQIYAFDLPTIDQYLVADNEKWTDFGYEAIECGPESGIVNGYGDADPVALTELYGPMMNEYGLFREFGKAQEFATVVGQITDGESPLFVLKYERLVD